VRFAPGVRELLSRFVPIYLGTLYRRACTSLAAIGSVRMNSRIVVAAFLLISLTAAAQNTWQENRKTADRKFWAMTALSSASTVSDIEVTAHALQNPNCAEHNPLFGSHPSRAKMYGVSIPASAAYTMVGYWLKKRGVKLWAVPQLSLTGAHAVGSGLSSRCF